MKRKLTIIAAAFAVSAALMPSALGASDSGSAGPNATWTVDGSGRAVISGTGEITKFTWSSSVKSVEIKNGITSIGDDVFWLCDSIESFSIPSSVTRIGKGAFDSCRGLKEITIPDSVSEIGESAFGDCIALMSVKLGSGADISGRMFYGCTSLTDVSVPNGVKRIGEYAFYGCSALQGITLPNSITDIGDHAFYECSSLKSITIPSKVTAVGRFTFSYCGALTEVTIPKTVTKLGSMAFYNSDAITDVYYGGSEEQWLGLFTNDAYGNESLKNAANIRYNAILEYGDVKMSASLENSGGRAVLTLDFGKTDGDYGVTVIPVYYSSGARRVGGKKSVTTSGTSELTDYREADSAEVYIWSNLDNMKALCAKQKVYAR